jgi:hypothetical protein
MIALRVTSCELWVPWCARRSRFEKQQTDPAYGHARQLKEATRGKGEGIGWRDLPNYVPSLWDWLFASLKLTSTGMCRGPFASDK